MKIEILHPSCNLETVRDGRGGIFTWLPQDPIVEFNVLYFQPGKTRGHHYHPEFNEYFLVAEGSGVMVTRDSEDAPEEHIHMSRGTCVRTPIGVSHTFYAITPVTAISMLSKKWDDCKPPIVRVEYLTGNKTAKREAQRIAVVGANGYVGSALCRELTRIPNYTVVPVMRENYAECQKEEFDILINCAMPSARFWAKQNPEKDFTETVEKTGRLVSGWRYKKFVQISTVSARCQLDTVYGRHKAAAEKLCDVDGNLIIRLGALYSNDLKKGVLVDMLQGKQVFVDGQSRYCFAPLDFTANWIATNLHRTGTVEVGGRNAIALKDVANHLGVNVAFEGTLDHQEIEAPEADFPEASDVLAFLDSYTPPTASRPQPRKVAPAIKIDACRVCGNTDLVPCIDIGEQYLSSVFPTDLSYHADAIRYPLEMVMCRKKDDGSTCGLVQLAHKMDLTAMYDAYPYTSSTNSSMGKILQDVAESGRALNNLQPDDLILDIGGNDGTLLSFFKGAGCRLVNIDPAQNVKTLLNVPQYTDVRQFFTKDAFDSVSPTQKAKLIFSIAMFYHLNDPMKLARDVAACLADDGVWIIQMAYLPAMIRTNMYDNIVHEHAGYYATHHMQWLLDRVGLEVFDVMENDVYGGSFRVFAKKKGCVRYSPTERLYANLRKEMSEGLFDLATYQAFMQRLEKTRTDLCSLLKSIKEAGKSVWIYGASTKGNTILQYCGLTNQDIAAAADSNPFKVGKYIIGADILIKDEAAMRAAKPDYLLALPYSFIDGFMKREAELIAQGTKFIVPLPEVKVI